MGSAKPSTTGCAERRRRALEVQQRLLQFIRHCWRMELHVAVFNPEHDIVWHDEPQRERQAELFC
jgi:hypothetical protein